MEAWFVPRVIYYTASILLAVKMPAFLTSNQRADDPALEDLLLRSTIYTKNLEIDAVQADRRILW